MSGERTLIRMYVNGDGVVLTDFRLKNADILWILKLNAQLDLVKQEVLATIAGDGPDELPQEDSDEIDRLLDGKDPE